VIFTSRSHHKPQIKYPIYRHRLLCLLWSLFVSSSNSLCSIFEYPLSFLSLFGSHEMIDSDLFFVFILTYLKKAEEGISTSSKISSYHQGMIFLSRMRLSFSVFLLGNLNWWRRRKCRPLAKFVSPFRFEETKGESPLPPASKNKENRDPTFRQVCGEPSLQMDKPQAEEARGSISDYEHRRGAMYKKKED
jgi:hypothetical protein